MAFVVLCSTTSFAVNMHFCGDHLMDISILGSAKSCGMEAAPATTPSDCSIEKSDCCSNENIIVNGQKDLKQSVDQLSFQQQLFAVTFYYTYVNLFEGLDQQINPFQNYSPPLLVTDIQCLDETYLI